MSHANNHVSSFSNRSRSRTHPSLRRSYAAVYRGALTHGFSLEYMRYLAQLRPYNLAYTSAKIRLAKAIFVAAILFPQFVLLYLPLVLAQRFIAGKVTSIDLDSMKLQASDVIRFNAIWAERFLFRPFVGRAGYVIDF